MELHVSIDGYLDLLKAVDALPGLMRSLSVWPGNVGGCSGVPRNELRSWFHNLVGPQLDGRGVT